MRGGGTSVVIVDGIFVLSQEALAAQCDVLVFCAEDLDVCLARRLRRDIVERGRSVESVLSQWLRFVRPGYLTFVAPTAERADLVIPRARDNGTALAILTRDIRRRVSGVDDD